jgi:hypothetical protein
MAREGILYIDKGRGTLTKDDAGPDRDHQGPTQYRRRDAPIKEQDGELRQCRGADVNHLHSHGDLPM